MMLPRSIYSSGVLLVVLLLQLQSTTARKKSGDFVLSGVNSEHVLGSFALSPHARGWFDLTLSSEKMYDNEQNLKLQFFTDENWSQFLKATTCDEKVKLAKLSTRLSFDYVRPPTNLWKSAVTDALHQEKEDRTHYWYFVITDCSLEYQYRDGAIPKLSYTFNVWNDVSGKPTKGEDSVQGIIQNKKVEMSHLGADEVGIIGIHTVTMILSGLIGILMAALIFHRLVDTHHVHLALFLVMAAAGCDSSSSLCEIIHLRWYTKNGYGWYLFDALSCHLEAMCDAMVTLLLLAIASGWTLPSDVVQVSTVQKSWISSLTGGLRNPMGALFSLNKGGLLTIFIVATHMVLAQWGRTFNDDFDSYHDLEHLPGKILMIVRITLGVIMLASSMHTRSLCPPSLSRFYGLLALVGTMWFQGLPAVTWICGWAVPYHLRHPTITLYGALLQTAALLLLSWLVSAHSTSFAKLSRMQQQRDSGFTDSLAGSQSNLGGDSAEAAAPTSWKIGKAKVRLD
eukprot:CAMPEP_0119009404 /NCGR_PEP_ID=MMETSP1176-20130426/4339_1 /TAXON_ID=265551 /ORGANISM="Synedropsis recta cf, Strain CCMP1620" /LENGTH=509 /DNA_ID=CAMNT_0006961913 /DNA_START=70 /DNA_END=1599 /DNA_ORIENTATION=+